MTDTHETPPHAIAARPAAGAAPLVGHVVPPSVLLATAVALLVLTWLTVQVAVLHLPIGSLAVWIALGIATIKAALVCMYFMHLRYDRPFNVIVLLATLFFVFLFIGLALMDTVAYQPEIIWTEAPAMQRK